MRTLRRVRWCTGAAVAVGIGAAGCGNTTAPEGCPHDALPLAGANCLVWEGGPALADRRVEIEHRIEDAVARVVELLPIDDVRIRILDAPGGTIPGLGIGGFNPGTHEIRLSLDPAWPTLSDELELELPRIVAHELHHARRRRAVGYGSRLGQAVVSEGLADHFAIEVFGGPPAPWSVALDSVQLAERTAAVLERFDAEPYDHPVWFFGADGSMPGWTGYSVGYALVAGYLDGHEGTSAAGLFDEPASSFRR